MNKVSDKEIKDTKMTILDLNIDPYATEEYRPEEHYFISVKATTSDGTKVGRFKDLYIGQIELEELSDMISKLVQEFLLECKQKGYVLDDTTLQVNAHLPKII